MSEPFTDKELEGYRRFSSVPDQYRFLDTIDALKMEFEDYRFSATGERQDYEKRIAELEADRDHLEGLIHVNEKLNLQIIKLKTEIKMKTANEVVEAYKRDWATQIEELKAEVARLKEALQGIVDHYDGCRETPYDCNVMNNIARAALKGWRRR